MKIRWYAWTHLSQRRRRQKGMEEEEEEEEEEIGVWSARTVRAHAMFEWLQHADGHAEKQI